MNFKKNKCSNKKSAVVWFLFVLWLVGIHLYVLIRGYTFVCLNWWVFICMFELVGIHFFWIGGYSFICLNRGYTFVCLHWWVYICMFELMSSKLETINNKNKMFCVMFQWSFTDIFNFFGANERKSDTIRNRWEFESQRQLTNVSSSTLFLFFQKLCRTSPPVSRRLGWESERVIKKSY